ncbi:MAG: sigma-70 family RNA polymerase sigma factor [Verrucomicrobiota bacterium]
MEQPETDQDSEFVALLTEHQAALRLYVVSLLPGDTAAADVAQQANSTIWRKRADFELGTNFKAWIFSIARFEVLNYRKRQAKDSRRLVFSDELEEMIAEELPTQADDLAERQLALRGCLERLKSGERELIQSRYFRETSLQEYADKVGRSVGGLKVSLHRVRNRLQTCIEQKLQFKDARA